MILIIGLRPGPSRTYRSRPTGTSAPQDLDATECTVIAAGATKCANQPEAAVFRVFRVYRDPAGHPFCLTTWATAAGPPESRRQA